MSAKFSAALQFLTSLADNTEFLFILVHNVDCLSNLADSAKFLLIPVHSVECLSNLVNITPIDSSKLYSMFSGVKVIFSYLYSNRRTEQILLNVRMSV
jgi:hypothetical protein